MLLCIAKLRDQFIKSCIKFICFFVKIGTCYPQILFEGIVQLGILFVMSTLLILIISIFLTCVKLLTNFVGLRVARHLLL